MSIRSVVQKCRSKVSLRSMGQCESEVWFSSFAQVSLKSVKCQSEVLLRKVDQKKCRSEVLLRSVGQKKCGSEVLVRCRSEVSIRSVLMRRVPQKCRSEVSIRSVAQKCRSDFSIQQCC